jgi:hypothetical protein
MLSASTVDFQHRAAWSAGVLAKGGTQARGPLHSERTSSDLTAARNPAGGAWLSPSHGGAPSARDATSCELQIAPAKDELALPPTMPEPQQRAPGSDLTCLIPWISLGCGYRREFETYEKFDLQWNVRLFCHLPAALATKTLTHTPPNSTITSTAGSSARSSMAAALRPWGQPAS